MPQSPLISKIKCNNPNKHRSSIHNRNYLIYIATRDGVDLSNVDLERELHRLEHTPSDADNEHYLNYIGERPGSQGLFGNIDVSNHRKVGQHLANLTSEGYLIYRGVISLREDDAIPLGFDQKDTWVDYMHLVMPEISKEFNIPIDKLQWTAAYHIKAGHPHCHYMFWCSEKQIMDPFIHPSKQTRIREMLSKEMFQIEREQAVILKTASRDMTLQTTKDFMADEIKLLFNSSDKLTGFFKNDDIKSISKDLVSLTFSLPSSGRLSYKLLPTDTKKKVDTIVEKVLATSSFRGEYAKYKSAVDKISATYSTSQNHRLVNMECADEDLRKRMANIILKSCKQLSLEKERLSVDYIDTNSYDSNEPNSSKPFETPQFYETPSSEPSSPEERNPLPESNDFESSEDIDNDIPDNEPDIYHITWSTNYKKAMSILYNENISDKSSVLQLLEHESHENNVLALHHLARMYEKGIHVKEDSDKARVLYNKALHGFTKCLQNPSYEKMHSYINYRLGKYYESGSGTLINYSKAIEHYIDAGDNKYALYSLGSMYQRGKGINLTPENKDSWLKKAGDCFKASLNVDPFPYASYAYAKLCENNPHVFNESSENISHYYSLALDGFNEMLCKQPNDDLLYRIGTMHYSGKGTEANQYLAYEFFLKSAEYNNANAQYALGKTYADKDTKYYNPAKAIEMFTLSSEQGNEYATYALGKMYATPGENFNFEKAKELFSSLLQSMPDQANYALGKMYVQTDSPYYNIDLAFEHLSIAAKLDNANAQYALGKIYSDETNKYYDISKAIEMFSRSAEQGNEYATYALGKMYATPGQNFNFEKAKELFSSLLQSMPDQANYALGKVYAQKNSPYYNPELAIKHLSISVTYNNTNAQYALAKIYLDENSHFYNAEKALSLLHESANSGNAYAMAKLGGLYLWGKHVTQDTSLGTYWLHKAIENGNPQAQDTLDLYSNYQKDIAISLTFSMCRNLLSLCANRQKPESINSIISKVRTREAAKEAQMKQEQYH